MDIEENLRFEDLEAFALGRLSAEDLIGRLLAQLEAEDPRHRRMIRRWRRRYPEGDRPSARLLRRLFAEVRPAGFGRRERPSHVEIEGVEVFRKGRISHLGPVDRESGQRNRLRRPCTAAAIGIADRVTPGRDRYQCRVRGRRRGRGRRIDPAFGRAARALGERARRQGREDGGGDPPLGPVQDPVPAWFGRHDRPYLSRSFG